MIFALLFILSATHSTLASSNATNDVVVVKSHINVKFIDVPTSEEPLLTWIEMQNGTFPNTQVLAKNEVKIGQPLTMYVYLRDKSRLYDLRVTQCWASATQLAPNHTNKTILMSGLKYGKGSILSAWQKYILPRQQQEIGSFLYATFKAFKFPDHNQIYITCDIELCYKQCQSGYRLSNFLK